MSGPTSFPPPTGPSSVGPPSGPVATGPAGWYTDPWTPDSVRWWDGTQWTAHTAPRHAVVAVPDEMPTLPIGAAIGGVILTILALVGSRVVLDALGRYRYPIVIYVVLSAVLGYLPMVLFFGWVARRWGQGSLRRGLGFEFRWIDAGWGPLVWLTAVAAEIGAASIITTIGIPLRGNTESIDDLSVERGVIIALLITAVVVAPFVEELMFRGVLLRGLSSQMPRGAAIVVQGILFGAAHVDPARGTGNLGLVLVLSSVGIVFGAAASRFGRVGPTIIAHAIFNSVVMVIALYVA